MNETGRFRGTRLASNGAHEHVVDRHVLTRAANASQVQDQVVKIRVGGSGVIETSGMRTRPMSKKKTRSSSRDVSLISSNTHPSAAALSIPAGTSVIELGADSGSSPTSPGRDFGRHPQKPRYSHQYAPILTSARHHTSRTSPCLKALRRASMAAGPFSTVSSFPITHQLPSNHHLVP